MVTRKKGADANITTKDISAKEYANVLSELKQRVRIEKLPKKLKSSLPTIEEIEEELKKTENTKKEIRMFNTIQDDRFAKEPIVYIIRDENKRKDFEAKIRKLGWVYGGSVESFLSFTQPDPSKSDKTNSDRFYLLRQEILNYIESNE